MLVLSERRALRPVPVHLAGRPRAERALLGRVVRRAVADLPWDQGPQALDPGRDQHAGR